MPAEKKHNSIVKREPTSLTRVSKSIEITNKLLAVAEEPFLIPYRKGNKWGFCDRNKKIIIPCIFEDVHLFSIGFADVKNNDKWGLINNTGKEVIPCIYDEVHSFSEELAVVKHNGKWGFIDKTWKEVIPCIYDRARDFSEGLASVCVSDKWGFIDRKGKEIIPFIYDDADAADNFSEGLAAVNLNNKWGYIDKTGKKIIPFIFNHAYPFKDGVAFVSKTGYSDFWEIDVWKWGFIDKNGKEIHTFWNGSDDDIYENIDFSEGLAPAYYDYEWKEDRGDHFEKCSVLKFGFINKTGKIIIPCIYDEVHSFSEELACTNYLGLYGFIDKSGKGIIPFIYARAYSFNEGLALVSKYSNDHLSWNFGFIDKTGKEIIPSIYDINSHSDQAYFYYNTYFYHGSKFSEGLVGAQSPNHNWGFIDKTGKEIIPFIYDWVEPFSNGLSWVAYNGKCGFIDKYGTEFWED
ncbi:MAG: WG repeat-containing protein [Bacteroidales bacterium]|jgi:hypothetical protein